MKTKQIDEATLAILSRVEIQDNLIKLPAGQLERKQYVAVNEILESMGGAWNRKAKAHTFAGDPTDKLESVLLTGEIIKPQDYGYYPTPPELVKRLIELADITSTDIILEPSAGQGAIAVAAACEVGMNNVDCYEILPENCKILRDLRFRVFQMDFLGATPVQFYDRVIMNPPFAPPKQIEIDHVLHAWEFLKPGGRLVSIMSTGVLFRENKKTVGFREMLNKYGHYERNPTGSFKISGTGVNTIIVIMDKPIEV